MLPVLVVVALGCGDRGGPIEGPIPRLVEVPVELSFVHYGVSLDESPTVNLIRLTARHTGTDAVLSPTPITFEVGPNEAEGWKTSLEVEIPAGNGVEITVLTELIHGDAGGGETVLFSGRAGPIALNAGDPEVALVSVHPGGARNLAATSVGVIDAETELEEGSSAELSAGAEGVSDPEVFWGSLDPEVGTVESAGEGAARVHGLLPGTARIIAAAGSRRDTVEIEVKQRPETLELDPVEGRTLGSLGEEASFEARVLDPRGEEIEEIDIDWSVEDETVAEHIGAGVFRAVANGSTSIRAVVAGREEPAASVPLVVEQVPAKVEIEPAEHTFTALGEELALSASVVDSMGAAVAGVDVEWTSSDVGVARVNGSGVVTAVAEGEAGIAATAPGGVEGAVTVTVSQTVSELEAIEGNGGGRARVRTERTLRVRALDGGGHPIAGAAVTWSVVSGGGSLGPSSTTAGIQAAVSSDGETGDDGTASVVWTLGDEVGEQAVSVMVGGETVIFTVDAVAAEPTTITVELSAPEVGAGETVTATARLFDDLGDPLIETTREITWSATDGGSFASGTTQVDSAGVTTVEFTTSVTAGVEHEITATDSSGVAGSGSVTTRAGPASTATSTLEADPESMSADGATESALTVTLIDANGNELGAGGPAVALNATAGTLSAVTDEGDGTYTATLTSTAHGAVATVTATLDGDPIAATATVEFEARALAGFTVEAAAGGAIPDQTAGEGFQVTITAVDAAGVLLPDFAGTVELTGTLALASGGGTTPAFVDGVLAGHAVQIDAAGTAVLTVTAVGGESGDSDAFEVAAADAASLAIVAGDGQTATVETDVAVAPQVRVLDAFGNAALGAEVAFAASAGGGSVTGSPATVGADGLATLGAWTLGTVAGPNTLTASVTGVGSVDFTATAVAADAARLELTTQPSATAAAGEVLARQPALRITDAHGNPVAEAGVTVTVAVATGGGAAAGTTTATSDAAGAVTFAGLAIEGTVGDYTLTFSAPGLTAVTSATVDVRPGAASTLQIQAGDGGTETVGAVRELQALVEDAFGNAVPGVDVDWAVASGGGSVAAATTATGADGVASVDWTIGTTAGSQSVDATAAGLAGSPLTYTLTATAADADPGQTTIAADDAALTADGTSTTTITVEVRDGFGNPATAGGDVIQLSSTEGTLPATPAHQGGGIYTATLTAPTTVGTATITGTLNGTAIVDDAQVAFEAGPATRLVLSGSGTQTAGTLQLVTLRAFDANNNVSAGYTGDQSLTFSGAAAAPDGTDPTARDKNATDVAFGTVTTVAFTAGEATTEVALYAAGNPVIDVTDGTISAAGADRLNVSVSPGDPDAIDLSSIPTPLSFDAFDQTGTVTAVVLDAWGNTGAATAVSWGVDAPLDVVELQNEDALSTDVLAIGNGSTNVSATAGAISTTTGVSVQQVVDHVVVDPATATILVGETQAFTATAFDSNANEFVGEAFTWSSADPATASIADANVGTAKGEATGATQIKATAGSNAVEGTADLTVHLAPTATDDGPYSAVVGDALTVTTAGTHLLDNDALGVPAAAIVTFGGGAVGGDATSNAAGAAVALAGGTLTVEADGSFTLIDTDTPGNYTFDYVLENSAGSDQATVTIEVRELPVAGDNAYATSVNTTLTVADGPSDLLADDDLGFPEATLVSFGGGDTGDLVDANAPGGTATLAGGALVVNADGSFSLTTPTDAGTFTFEYRLENAAGSDDGTVTIEVQAPPSPTDDAVAGASAPGDSYHTSLNTTLTISDGADDLLANDDLGGPEGTLTHFGAIESNDGAGAFNAAAGAVTDNAAGATVTPIPGHGDGSLTVAADGTLALVPPTDYTGLLRFQYRLANAGGSGDATVTLAVGVRPAAVADAYGVMGNVSIAPNAAGGVLANDAGDLVEIVSFGATADATTTGAAGSSTSSGDLTVAADGSFTFNPAAGFEGSDTFLYRIVNGFGAVDGTVTATVDGMIWFVDGNAGTNGDGRLSGPFSTLANYVSAAADDIGDAIFLYESATEYTGGITLLDSQRLIGQDASTGTLASLAGVTVPSHSATLPTMSAATPATTLGGASGGVTLGSGNRLYGLTIAPSSGTGVTGSSFGTLTVDDVSIDSDAGALSLVTGTLVGSFDQIRSSGGANNVLLSDVSTSGTAVLGTSADALSGSSDHALHIIGNGGSFTYAGTISNAAGDAVRSVRIVNKTGGTVTLSGSINPSAAGGGIEVASNATGTNTITFSGAQQRISTGATTGVSLTGNTGATIGFTGGDLQIATTTGDGFIATSSGTVVVDGAVDASTIGSAGGTALKVDNTTIGAGGLNFRRIIASTGANGIFLRNTGTSGGLTVTGNSSGNCGGLANTNPTGAAPYGTRTAPDAADCTGGTIQNTTGADGSTAGTAIYLESTKSPSLTRMRLTGTHDNYGIRGVGLNGLTLNNVLIDGTFGNAGDEYGLYFSNLTGSASVTNSFIRGGYAKEFVVFNTSGGTLNRITFDNVTFGQQSLTTTAGEGVMIQSQAGNDGGTLNATVRNSRFMGQRASAITFAVQSSTTSDLVVENNVVYNQLPYADQISGNAAISLAVGGNASDASTATYRIEDNRVRGQRGVGIAAQAGLGTTNTTGQILNNRVGEPGVTNSGAREANGMFLNAGHFAKHKVLVEDNELYQYNGIAGMWVFVGGVGTAPSPRTGSMHATIRNNTLSNPGDFTEQWVTGIAFHMGTNTGDAYTTCLNVTGNDIANSFRDGFGGSAGLEGEPFDFEANNSTIPAEDLWYKLDGYPTFQDTPANATRLHDTVSAANGGVTSNYVEVPNASSTYAGNAGVGAVCDLFP